MIRRQQSPAVAQREGSAAERRRYTRWMSVYPNTFGIALMKTALVTGCTEGGIGHGLAIGSDTLVGEGNE